MKKFIFTGFAIAIFALAGAIALPLINASAETAAFNEKFADDKKLPDTGETGVYSFNLAHSSIGFRVKHMGLVEVPGYFRDFTGKINYDAKDIAKSSVEFKAMTKSIDTGVAGRDKHLRSADFFDVEKFPELTFKSTKVEKKGKQWMLTGDLTMKGVTKSIAFPFNINGFLKDEKGGTTMGASAETTINRRDFGVNYGKNLPNGIPMLSDDIIVVLQVEAPMEKTEK